MWKAVVADLMSEEELNRIKTEYFDVFTSDPPFGGSKIQAEVDVIPTEPNAKPILKPMFRYSPIELEEMEKQVQQ